MPLSRVNSKQDEQGNQAGLLTTKQFVAALIAGASLCFAIQRYWQGLPKASRPSTSLSPSRLKSWLNKSITRIDDVSLLEIREVLQLACELKSMPRETLSRLAEGYVASLLFFEPSTRTRCSFECAMMRIGGQCSVMTDMSRQSSTKKGESFSDTIRTVSQYSDIIVLRHPDRGSSDQALSSSDGIPILNAGDGDGEHPTQALLDLLAIQECGLSQKKNLNSDGDCAQPREIDGLTVTVLGDLKFGRTVHSLIRALSKFENVCIYAVSPESLALPKTIKDEFVVSNDGETGRSSLTTTMKLIETTELSDKVLNETDVLYVTRVQKERFDDEKEYHKVQGCFTVDCDTLSKCKSDMVLLHPLPRVGEIKEECDGDHRACYFDQVQCGLYVRMALICLSLGLFLDPNERNNSM